MIKSLKTKFIVINMILVFLVVAIATAVLFIFTSKRLEAESNNLLLDAIERQESADYIPDFGNKSSTVMLGNASYVVITIDDSGNILKIVYNNARIDSDFLDEIVAEIYKDSATSGVIKEYNVRFLCEETSEGLKIALMDTTSEQSIKNNLIVLSLLVSTCVLFAFFVISLILSNVALKPAEIAWNRQKQFVAYASHELKTPLTVILANTDILLSNENNKISDQKKWIVNTKDEAMRMKALVEKMLYLAKVDASMEKPMAGAVNLSDLTYSTALAFEALAFERRIKLDIHTKPNVKVNADENELKQLIGILLDNAIKYCGDNGAVYIKVSNEFNKPSLKIRNTGSYIPSDERAHIFERFYRSDYSRSRDEGGYGLGLSIAKSICDKYRTLIYVTSDKNSNETEFSVIFL